MKVEEWLSTELGVRIWEKKYRYKQESFDSWILRVSGGDQQIAQLLLEKKFLFGGRTLTNRGVDNGSMSNCYSSGFVLDNLADIMAVNTKLALTYKAQGGQGVSLSKIRPKGSLIRGLYESDGIVPIMEMYNTTTASIMQGGSRKGALMISLDIKHKEAETFITIKSDPTKITKANLSAEIDNEFMEAVEKFYTTGEVIKLHITREYEGQLIAYDIVPIHLYKLLMERAWQSAEPGVIFTDKFRNYNLMEFCDDYQIETCNPCGEQPLPKDGACNLGSINLSQYVLYPFTKNAEFDYNSLFADVASCIRALDQVVDENLPKHGLPEQAEVSKKYRNVGLGIMGLADAFIKLGIKYGSEESVAKTKLILEVMLIGAVESSSLLAAEKGVFPAYDPKVFDSQIISDSIYRLDRLKTQGLRNCSLLSIAPTGSLGTMFNVSTGIEPNFAFEFNRKTESLEGNKEKIYKVSAGIVQEYLDYLESIGQPFTELPEYFVSAYDVQWKDRIAVQAAAQRFVDTAISATINLPKDISKEEVEMLYLEAWKSGLKGVTIYRDTCRDAILSTQDQVTSEFFHRPAILQAKVVHFVNDSKPWVAFVGIRDNKPFEIFTGPADMEVFPIPKSVKQGEIIKVKIEGQDSRYDFRYTDSYGYQNTLGGLSRCFNKEFYNYARLVSGMLRQQIEITAVLAIVGGMQFENETLNSWKNGVIRALKEFIQDGTLAAETCPECGSSVIYTEGCKQCPSCGWGKC